MLNDVDLRFGDCLELMKTIPDRYVDAVICDLPYGVTKNKWDSVIPLDLLWVQYCRIIKPDGIIILFGSGMFTVRLANSKPEMWRYNLIWHKTTPTGFLNANRQPLRAHEDISVFYCKQPTYNPQKTDGHKRKISTAAHKRNCKITSDYGKHALRSYDSTERYPTSVLTFPTDKQKASLHPTQKPVALLEYLIRTYTNPGELVLDNCMGSGSTGVACINTGRRFIGMENNGEFFDIAKQRIEEAQIHT